MSESFISKISLSHIFNSLLAGKNREVSGSTAERRKSEVWSAPRGSASPESDLSRLRSEARTLPKRFLCICLSGTLEICPCICPIAHDTLLYTIEINTLMHCVYELGHQQSNPHQHLSQMDHFMVYDVLSLHQPRLGNLSMEKGWSGNNQSLFSLPLCRTCCRVPARFKEKKSPIYSVSGTTAYHICSVYRPAGEMSY